MAESRSKAKWAILFTLIAVFGGVAVFFVASGADPADCSSPRPKLKLCVTQSHTTNIGWECREGTWQYKIVYYDSFNDVEHESFMPHPARNARQAEYWCEK